MARKTWFKVKRGILDPKHIDRLGNAWYLYFYILDNADWETGTIPEWKDIYAADDLGKPLGMIREHRKQLVDGKYIRCDKQQYSQKITIFNWTDPRRYDGIVQNINTESWDFSELQEDDLEIESYDQSKGQSSPQSSGQTFPNQAVNDVPFIQSQNHISHNTVLTTTTAFAVFAAEIGSLSPTVSERLGMLVDDYSDQWVQDAIKEAVLNNVKKLPYIEAMLKSWKENGKGKRVKRKYNKSNRGGVGIDTAEERRAKIADSWKLFASN